MSCFLDLCRQAGLSKLEASELLGTPQSRIEAYERGELRPSPREIQTLKGLMLSGAIKSGTKCTDDSIMTATRRNEPIMRKRSRKSSLVSLELCAGAGGAALGLEHAGFEPAALIEIDRHACATLRRNRPYWNVIEADLRRVDTAYWHDSIDLLSGGLPCPPFSIAGKQLGADDDRDMFPSMLRIVKETRPRAVLIENVRGILTSRFDGFRKKVDDALEAEGFKTYWAGFNAAQFGVPQNRFRAFLVALRKGHTKKLSWPIAPTLVTPTVGEALVDLMAERGWRGAETWARKANAPAPTIVGGSHKHGGPDLGPTRARREWAELGVDGLGLADAPPESDFHGMPRLTIPMIARLQSFPDDWKFVGAKTHMYRQVGNALPVRLAFSVASAVRECLV